METLTQPDTAFTDTEPKLYLLPERYPVEDWQRWRTAASVSGAVHAVLILTLIFIPGTSDMRVYESPRIVRITPLYIPTELTQKAPNRGKLQKELTAEAVAPRPVLKAPAPAPAARKLPAPVPPPVVAQTRPEPVVVEPPPPPKIETEIPAQQAQIAKLNAPPPLPPAEAPKLTLQEVGAPPPRAPSQGRLPGIVAIPNPSVQEAVRNLARNGMQSGQTVGDIGADEVGVGGGLNLPPSAGRPRSNLQLKSDPLGVDFRPYLTQVLQAVRRNWFAVYPEAARLGQRGQVVLEFSIAKQGAVVKVVFNGESGAKALDQAAVAAISASNPMPPLPSDFKGERVVLQMTFLYNMPR